MDDRQIAATVLRLRIRERLTQEQIAIAADVPRSVVQLAERGRLARIRIDDLRRIASALDASLDLTVRWHGGDLGRLVNARHAALHEALAMRFADLRGWELEPEVSFSVFGERGAIDGLGWHAATASLLVIELKTELVDINDLMSSVDRKRRLAAGIARARSWVPTSVSSWVAVADGRTNRRALARHATTLRAKFPVDGHVVGAWLRTPVGAVDALGFLTVAQSAGTGLAVSGSRRVRHARSPLPDSERSAT